MSPRSLVAVALLVTASCAPTVPTQPSAAAEPPADEPLLSAGVFLHVVPMVVRAEERVDASRPVRVLLMSDKPEELARVLGARVQATHADQVVATLAPGLVWDDAPGDAFVAPSFVVDYDSEVVARLRDAAGARLSSGIAAVRDYVAEVIENKNMTRGWDVASTVAERREGDCTEHAVLMAALARAVGVPARVIQGLVLVIGEEGVGAFGHAWAEVRTGEGWRLVDATDAGERRDVIHVPLHLLRDESHSYAMTMLGDLQRVWISGVEVLGN